MKLKLIPTIFTVFAFIVLVSLGVWQLKRLDWKVKLVDKVNSLSAMEELEYPFDDKKLDEYIYRLVKIEGEYIHDKEKHLFVGAKKFKGKMGYDVLTPFKTISGDIILVNRGWVPHNKKSPDLRPETLTDGVLTVSGMLHKSEEKKNFLPDNDIENNIWFTIDVPKILENNKIKWYLRLLKTDENIPIGGNRKIEFRNDHLQYVIIWFSLAIILLIVYFCYHIQENRKHKALKG